MRARGRVDANQSEIMRYLRSLGMSVQALSAVGNGCPDLLVGFRGVTVPVEVKDGNKVASKRALTVAQEDWHGRWAGSLVVAKTKEEAAEMVIGIAGRKA